MKIKMLTAIAFADANFVAGDEVEVSDESAQNYIEAGLAEAAEDKPSKTTSKRKSAPKKKAASKKKAAETETATLDPENVETTIEEGR